jgi:hypothetical protein
MKIKKTDEFLIKVFWESPDDALFNSRTIALVLAMSDSSFEKHRANGRGPKFSKLLNTTIVYRKRDVLEFIKEFEK